MALDPDVIGSFEIINNAVSLPEGSTMTMRDNVWIPINRDFETICLYPRRRVGGLWWGDDRDMCSAVPHSHGDEGVSVSGAKGDGTSGAPVGPLPMKEKRHAPCIPSVCCLVAESTSCLDVFYH